MYFFVTIVCINSLAVSKFCNSIYMHFRYNCLQSFHSEMMGLVYIYTVVKTISSLGVTIVVVIT